MEKTSEGIKIGSSKLLIYLTQVLPSILISVIITYILISSYANITKTAILFTDPVFTGLFGSLVGACIGASAGGIVSLQLHQESLRAASAIKDKDEIYKVLYTGLVKFKSDITKTERRYHTDFTFKMSGIDTINPKFVEWDQLKNDSRIIQIPKWLRSIFEQYFLEFSKYQDLLAFAQADFITIKRKLIQEVGLTYRELPGLDENYLIGLMNQSNFFLQDGLEFEEKDLKGIDVKDIEQRVITACLLAPSIERAKSFYDNVLLKNTDEMASILELVIQYINNKYENQDDVI
jgi:hypothetical protein